MQIDDASHGRAPPGSDDTDGADARENLIPRRPLVAGLGDSQRHDYGVGSAVLRHLRGRGLNATLVSCDGGASALAGLWRDRDLAILVDPVCADPSHPGRVHRLVIPRSGAGRLLVYAVEVGDISDGSGLTPAVAAAARRVADSIAAEIGSVTPVRRSDARTESGS
jgi:hydrogenase maturation protease